MHFERFYYENQLSGLSSFRYRLDHHLQPQPLQPPDELPLETPAPDRKAVGGDP